MALNDALWEFPVHYPMKVMGRADGALKERLTEIILRYVADFDASTYQVRPSSKGKYVSFSTTLYLTEKSQVEGLYADLNDCEDVLWAL